MRLIAFRIRNFRSIVDTGWQPLSPDNITCLIGQNESGKTSVLEGLKVFYTGIITEDVLRSDMSLPEISCRFSVPEGWLLRVTENPGTELKELLTGLTRIELTRVWIADLSSVMVVSGEISQYLDSLEDAWRLYLDDVSNKLENEMTRICDLRNKITELSGEESEIRSKLPPGELRGKGIRIFNRRSVERGGSNGTLYPGLKNRLSEIRKIKEEFNSELSSRNEIKKNGELLRKLADRKSLLDRHLAELSVKLEERHQKMTLLIKPPGHEDEPEWKGILEDYRRTRAERETAKNDLDRHIALSGYLMEGNRESEALARVNDKMQSYKSQYNSEMLGSKYFEYCPVFELFEDFGSLLPNRIDMEDILSGNEKVEGFKAARNFLNIARLDYSFFQQPSSRILKQKIENLNQSLTRNFHDFWQQSIGSSNKIQIQFELDHYDASHGPRAGKPYLEFWIKDDGERLYPKQRSRGVRWFLSFYMELKAAAVMNKQMILLVDEPGVSLHARAQEDVLKVFEDIRNKIQVIYTTHSPHLVEINKLHRVLAVQRDDIENTKSATRILDPLGLSAASPDTLSPLQSILGNPVGTDGFSSKRFNLIVNDTGSFYILRSIIHLMDYKGKISIIPSAGTSSMPLLCNILMGWGMDFALLLFENDREIALEELLKESLYNTSGADRDMIIRLPGMFFNAEDLLSTLDFKNHVLKTREGITVANSEYIREKGIARNFLFSRFLSEVKKGDIKISDFDEETNENFRHVIEIFKSFK